MGVVSLMTYTAEPIDQRSLVGVLFLATTSIAQCSLLASFMPQSMACLHDRAPYIPAQLLSKPNPQFQCLSAEIIASSGHPLAAHESLMSRPE